MRIISGIYKGRKIIGYNVEGTRPTQDRIRESLFGMIQLKLRDASVLDLFAGTGSLGLEALSNGAMDCTFVDSNPKCIANIKKTLQEFRIENANLLNLDYQKALALFEEDHRKFDLIFLDPPYRYQNIEEILGILTEKCLINEDGIIVCEFESDDLKSDYAMLRKIKEKRYGSKTISIYQYK
ncbi:MAG: 16S rRNA (guanine(966)-N(2))-methyltransferase RsmD [Bacilli bacterium]|nr:16S rRNA (guanine(966)-N(2))-methyltransferase RsmD [Bacilli bacterium]